MYDIYTHITFLDEGNKSPNASAIPLELVAERLIARGRERATQYCTYCAYFNMMGKLIVNNAVGVESAVLALSCCVPQISALDL